MNTELLECECKSTKRAQTMGGKVKMLIKGMLDYTTSEVRLQQGSLRSLPLHVLGDVSANPCFALWYRYWATMKYYAKFEPLKGPQSVAEAGTRKALIVKIPGAFVHPLDTRIENIKHLSFADIATNGFTAVVSTLYTSLDSRTVLKLLPKHGKSNSFPYVDSKNATAFIVDNPTRALTEKSNNAEKIMCHQCIQLIHADSAAAENGK
ncbi:hypothetical protein B0H13DRAFT_1878036 [Mycena leptocephala]|nr:hypothetical protein B0H13DRAFT_1878036 [Mycena leptocephala]